jgi:hypothetical protein
MTDSSSSIDRQERLDAVFKKAIDVSANSLTDADLEACFGELRNQYGAIMQKLFMNTVGRLQSNIEVGGH